VLSSVLAGLLIAASPADAMIPMRQLHTQEDFEVARTTLRRVFWGTGALPVTSTASRPVAAETALAAAPDLVPLVERVDVLTVWLPYELTSTVYVLVPPGARSDCAFIYHGGHDRWVVGGGDTLVASVLQRGCRTAVLDMPAFGANEAQLGRKADGSQVLIDRQSGHRPFFAWIHR